MKNKDKAKAREKYIQNRKELIALSKVARMMIETGDADSVNDALIQIYDKQQGEQCEYNTFNQWKQKGYTINKGVTAFHVWGQPRQVSQVPEGASEPEEYKYWPICYLFSDLQVIKPEPATKQPERRQPEPEPEEVMELDEAMIGG